MASAGVLACCFPAKLGPTANLAEHFKMSDLFASWELTPGWPTNDRPWATIRGEPTGPLVSVPHSRQ